MEHWTRRRNIAILVTAVVLQLILLGYQVRGNGDMTLLRAWSVGAVSPVNKALHGIFSFVSSSWSSYVWLVDARDESEGLQEVVDRLKLENEDLRRNLERFERQEVLVSYQDRIASKTLLAEVIGGGANSNSKEIILNQGRKQGVLSGMAVVTADGIVGKVQASYPGSSLAVLINDADAGVGVILADSRVRGVLKGRGSSECLLDYVAHEVPVRVGEVIYTSGDDRVFPKGLRVGQVSRVEGGSDFQGIYVRPFAQLDRLDEVLIVSAGAHEELPPRWEMQLPQTLMPPAPEDSVAATPAAGGEAPDEEHASATDADRLKKRYRALAEAQGRRLGTSELGEAAPDFNLGLQNPDGATPDPAAAAEIPPAGSGTVAGGPARPQP